MYTEDDLKIAVDNGIFTSQAVDQFRAHMASIKHTSSVDEENFRLITGFNDVFVVIASMLLLVSAAWLTSLVNPAAAAAVVAALSWVLAEFFVRQRRMALPAIVLLVTFLGGVFATPIALFANMHNEPSWWVFLTSGIMTAIAARMHWLRFQVPITIAAVTAALIGCAFGALFTIYPLSSSFVLPLMFAAGVATFVMAMIWDASDRERQTRRSDTAFWLHLLSAPLLVHPVFSALGITHGTDDLGSAAIVLALYIGLAVISIAVDRRAIMVSALVYVLYAFSGVLNNFGMVSYSFAVTGICIGATLLLLSAFWQPSRQWIINKVPGRVQHFLPVVHG